MEEANSLEKGSLAFLKNDMAAMVRFKPLKPLCVEKVSDFPELGRFVMLDLERTVAIGSVHNVKKSNAPA